MPRTQVPEEDQRVSTTSDLQSYKPRPQAVIRTEGKDSVADGLGNLYWWDPSADAANANPPESYASTVSGFTDGDPDEGLWRRMVAPPTGNVGAVQYNDGNNAFAANDTYLYVDDSNGNVGVGTNNPQETLVIGGSTTSESKRMQFVPDAGTFGSTKIYYDNGKLQFTDELNNSNVNVSLGVVGSTDNYFQNSVGFNTDSAGNVANFHIGTGFSDSVAFTDQSDGSSLLAQLNKTSSGAFIASLNDSSSTETIRFETDSDSYINTGANFGVGTDSPSSTLQVGGDADVNDYEFKSLSDDLGGDDTGGGVYTNGFRSYLGLIPLVNSGDKEYVIGEVTGARGTVDKGGKIEFYAENDPFNDGLDITLTSGYVNSEKGAGEARLVEFDFNGNTWVGLEVEAGGSGINQEIRFRGRKISDSGSAGSFPQIVDFGNISNLAAFSGSFGIRQEEAGKKILYGGNMGIGGDPAAQGTQLYVDGKIHATDDIRSEGDVIAFYSSDRRLKNNITRVDSALSDIQSMNGYGFEWKEEASRNGKAFGLIAQEAEKVDSRFVREQHDGHLGIDYNQLHALEIEAIKEIDDKLERENERLRRRIEELEKQVQQLKS